jgi:hypothetical protein
MESAFSFFYPFRILLSWLSLMLMFSSLFSLLSTGRCDHFYNNFISCIQTFYSDASHSQWRQYQTIRMQCWQIPRTSIQRGKGALVSFSPPLLFLSQLVHWLVFLFSRPRYWKRWMIQKRILSFNRLKSALFHYFLLSFLLMQSHYCILPIANPLRWTE